MPPAEPIKIQLEERPFRGTISEFVEKYMTIDGKPFTFNRREYLRTIYDECYPKSQRTILKCARQCEKSTSLAMKQLTYCSLVPWFKTLYVSPSQMQTRQFSSDRVRASAERSPFIRRLFQGKQVSDQVFDKRMANGSTMYFRYAFLHPDRCRGITVDLLCYDRETEIMTIEGWKPIYEITEEDLIADVNDQMEVEWNNPTAIVRRSYSGPMVLFNHRSMQLRVTADHRMVVNYKLKNDPAYHQEDKWIFERAMDLTTTNRMGFKMTAGASWPSEKFPDKKSFQPFSVIQAVSSPHGKTGKVRTRSFPGLEVDYKAFARFVGYYLAEGSIQWCKPKTGRPTPRARLSQNEGDVLEDMKLTLQKMGVGFCSFKNKLNSGVVLQIQTSHIGKYCEKLGKSWDKYIPREFFDCPDFLRELLYGMYLGDAMYHPEETSWEDGVYKTRSKRLAEDIQEAWLRLGSPASIHTDYCTTQGPNTKEKRQILAPIYLVEKYNHDYYVFWRSEFQTKERIKIELAMDEEVYCFAVKNHRPIVKRGFGGSPVICGNCVDEIQDILTDNIPVIRECLSHSMHKLEIYSGTPKTTSNAIEFYWNKSTQNEWMVKCRFCSYWNMMDMSIIKDTFMGCTSCGKPIYAIDGQWVSTHEGDWEGFRISQLMVPWVSFDEIKQKQKDYSTAKFHNEVLGIPYDSGVKPITEAQLRIVCTAGPMKMPEQVAGFPVFAGIDWGSGEGEQPSWTVLALGSFLNPPKFTVFFCKRFTGPEADLLKQVGLMGQHFLMYHATLAGADWGYGHYQNMQLRDAWGLDRVAEFEYTTQNIPVKFEASNFRFKLDRTTVMSNFFHEIVNHKIEFFDWEQFKTFGQDFLNIDCEYSEGRNKMTYTHFPDRCDDSFHACLYAWLAGNAYYKRLPGI